MFARVRKKNRSKKPEQINKNGLIIASGKV